MEGKTLKGRRMRRTSETAGTEDLPLTLLFVPGFASGPVLSILTCPWVEEQGCPNFSTGSPTCWGTPQPWTKEAGWSHYLQVKVTQPPLMLAESQGPKNSHWSWRKGIEPWRKSCAVTAIVHATGQSQEAWGGSTISQWWSGAKNLQSSKSVRELLELGGSLHTMVPGSSI